MCREETSTGRRWRDEPVVDASALATAGRDRQQGVRGDPGSRTRPADPTANLACHGVIRGDRAAGVLPRDLVRPRQPHMRRYSVHRAVRIARARPRRLPGRAVRARYVPGCGRCGRWYPCSRPRPGTDTVPRAAASTRWRQTLSPVPTPKGAGQLPSSRAS